jgi:hypothetical protein
MSAKQTVERSAIPLPSLEIPRSFDEWERTMEKAGYSAEELISSLMAEGSPLAFLRAARFVLAEKARANEYCKPALLSPQQDIHLLALVVLTEIDLKDAHTNKINPASYVESANYVLEDVIQKAEQIRGSELMQEVLVRALLVKTGVNNLLNQSHQNEGLLRKAELLARHMGFKKAQLNAKYQLAVSQAYLGQIDSAHEGFQSVYEDTDTPINLLENSKRSIAKCLLLLGNENGLEEFLKENNLSNEQELQVEMLRDIIEDNSFNGLNGSRELAKYWYHIGKFQEQRGEASRKHLDAAAINVDALIKTNMGAGQTKAYVCFAFVLLKQCQFTAAQQALPPLEKIKSLPVAERLFACCTYLEIHLGRVSEYPAGFYEAQTLAANTLKSCSIEIRNQLCQKLQTLCPLGLVLVSRHRNTPIEVRPCVDKAIMNFKAKTIEVYGHLGLRPSHAINFMLIEYNQEMNIQSLGGGQRNGLEEALLLPYHRRKIWFTPCSSLRIIDTLLKLYESLKNDVALEYLLTECEDLKRNFHLLPKIQKMEMDYFLEQTEKSVSKRLEVELANIS